MADSLTIPDAIHRRGWHITISKCDLRSVENGLSLESTFEFDGEKFDMTKESALKMRDYLNAVYPVSQYPATPSYV